MIENEYYKVYGRGNILKVNEIKNDIAECSSIYGYRHHKIKNLDYPKCGNYEVCKLLKEVIEIRERHQRSNINQKDDLYSLKTEVSSRTYINKDELRLSEFSKHDDLIYLDDSELKSLKQTETMQKAKVFYKKMRADLGGELASELMYLQTGVRHPLDFENYLPHYNLTELLKTPIFQEALDKRCGKIMPFLRTLIDNEEARTAVSANILLKMY